MTPTLLSPRQDEEIPPNCPERLALVSGDGTHTKTILPFLNAIGEVRFERSGLGGLAREIALHLERAWRDFRVRAQGPVTQPPVRVIYKHYPRPDLPGKCVTIHATIYSVRDSHFDHEWFRERMHGAKEPAEVRGAICDLRRTYQLDGVGEPRLIEAVAAAHTEILVGVRRLPLGMLAGEEEPLLVDREFSSHFMAYGGGVRRGFAWLDRSHGVGEAKPWAKAYRITARSTRAQPQIEWDELSQRAIETLRALVCRS